MDLPLKKRLLSLFYGEPHVDVVFLSCLNDSCWV